MCRGRERDVSMTMKKKVGIMMLAACLLVTVLANIASARVHYDEGEGIATYAVVPAEENPDMLPDIMLQQDGVDR